MIYGKYILKYLSFHNIYVLMETSKDTESYTIWLDSFNVQNQAKLTWAVTSG